MNKNKYIKSLTGFLLLLSFFYSSAAQATYKKIESFVPLGSVMQAKKICPVLCKRHTMEWRGSWTTNVSPNICICYTHLPAYLMTTPRIGSDSEREAYAVLAQKLRSAVAHNDIQTATTLIKEKNISANLASSHGPTLLTRAVENQSLEMVNLLLNNGADVNAREDLGDSPLLKATRKLYSSTNPGSEKRAKDIIRLLVNRGAQVNIKAWGSRATPLMYTTKSPEMTMFLIQHKAQVNDQSTTGRTALMITRNPEVARILLDNGADIEAKDKAGRTALMVTQSIEIAKMLVDRGADVNAVDNAGVLILHGAVLQSNPEFSAYLRKHGAKGY